MLAPVGIGTLAGHVALNCECLNQERQHSAQFLGRVARQAVIWTQTAQHAWCCPGKSNLEAYALYLRFPAKRPSAPQAMKLLLVACAYASAGFCPQLLGTARSKAVQPRQAVARVWWSKTQLTKTEIMARRPFLISLTFSSANTSGSSACTSTKGTGSACRTTTLRLTPLNVHQGLAWLSWCQLQGRQADPKLHAARTPLLQAGTVIRCPALTMMQAGHTTGTCQRSTLQVVHRLCLPAGMPAGHAASFARAR